MKNAIIKYGLYGVAVLLGINIIFWAIIGPAEPDNFKIGEIVGYSTIVLSLLFIFFGIRHYRDEVNQGNVKFWRAFLLGLGIAALPALGFAIYNYVYIEILDPAFMDKYWSYSMEKAKMSMEASDYQAHVQKMKESKDFYMNTFFQSGLMFFTVFLIGVVISLISAFILKKEESLSA